MKEITRTGIMLDTNVINKLLENEELYAKLPKNNVNYFITDIQYLELKRTPQTEKRDALLRLCKSIPVKKIPAINQQWFAFDTGNFHAKRFQSKTEAENLNAIYDRKMTKKGKVTNSMRRQMRDTLILLSSQGYNMTLVNKDGQKPFKKAKTMNFSILSLENFLEKYKN